MCFCIPVPRFLRQNRVLCRIDDFIKRFDLNTIAFSLLFGVFPFFQLFHHSTLWLLPICAFLLFALLISFVRQERIAVDFPDFLVLLFLLLQISTAITGFGRATDALTAALLTSVWFSARRFFGERSEKGFVFLSSLALLIISAIGVGQYVFGVAELRWVDAKRFGDIGGRVTSLFSNPNILAVYLLLYFPLALWTAFSPQKRRRWRLFYAATALLCAVCILLTWSRGAWLGLLLEVFLFLLFYSSKSRAAVLWLPPLALLSIPLLPQSFRGRLLSIGDLGESSIRYRLQTWKGAWRMLGGHPVGIGVGERAWRAIYPHFAVSGTSRVMHAHNIFLQIATELGVVGLILFSLLIGVSLWRGVRERNIAVVAAVAGALVMGTFDHLWYYPGMLVPFWSMLALCTQREQKVKKTSPFVDILHEN